LQAPAAIAAAIDDVSGGIKLTATAVSGADSYTYYYSLDGGVYTVAASGQDTDYTFTPTEAGSYSFGVTAVKGSGESAMTTLTPSGLFDDVPDSEGIALMAFAVATDWENWTDNTDWMVDSTVGNWFGVTVSGGHVTEIDSSSNNLNGDVGTTLDDLSSVLTTLDLSSNDSLTVPPYGIKWDSTNSDPSTSITQAYLINGVLIEQGTNTELSIQSQMARCLLVASTGSKSYLDPTDSTLLADGETAATLDGSAGDVEVEIPKHYQLWHRDGDDQYILLSKKAFSFGGVDAWIPLCFNDQAYYYIDAYEGVLYDDSSEALIDGQDVTPELADKTNDVCRSLPEYKPWVYEERGQYRQLYANRGGKTHQQMWDAHQMLLGLFVTEYGTWDSQTALPGYDSAGPWDFVKVRKTGRTAALGNASGSITVDLADADADLKPSVAGGGTDWTESATTPGEYYYGGDLVPVDPVKLFRADVQMSEGTLGSLGNDEWAWGDQDDIGADRLYCKVAEGDPDGLAADTIVAQLVSDSQAIANSYRGIENPFGHVWKFLDGINIDNTDGSCAVYTCAAPDDFADDTADGYIDTGHAPGFGDDDGYITDILGAGKHCPLYPSAISGGSSATFLCDYHYNNQGGWRVLLVGGPLSDSGTAGLVFLYAHYGSGGRYSHIGSRGAVQLAE
jgi:hypothetical protein